jgi:hypothetical protein
MVRNWLSAKHPGTHEVIGLAALYAAYEVIRGFGDQDIETALAHTGRIVALERGLGIYVEQAVQTSSQHVGGLPALLGILYMALHFLGTAAAMVWVHRARPEAYPIVRTTLVLSTALALVGYVLFPAAPPRLANLGFLDTVTDSTGINLSSDLLGSFYNPIAAVPSLHFGYAAIVGATLATLASRRAIRLLGVAYPALMLFVIVATGNHFLFDAAAGGLTVVVAWLLARAVVASPDRAADGSARGAARDRQLVLGVLDPLLELPAVGARFSGLDLVQLGSRRLELGLRPGVVDLGDRNGVVDERERTVGLDLEEPRTGRKLEHLRPAEMNPGRAGLEGRHQRRVAREHADLPGRAGHDEHSRLTLEHRALRRHERDVERRMGVDVRHRCYAAACSS